MYVGRCVCVCVCVCARACVRAHACCMQWLCSMVLKTLNAVKLQIQMDILSDLHFIKWTFSLIYISSNKIQQNQSLSDFLSVTSYLGLPDVRISPDMSCFFGLCPASGQALYKSAKCPAFSTPCLQSYRTLCKIKVSCI